MLERQLIGGVERLRVCRAFFGRGLYHTAAYRVGEVLVDSGCAHTAGEMVAALERGAPPRLILNTHGHEDHIGANGPLQARFGLRVMAHPLALPVLAAPRARQPEQLYRRLVWGYPAPCRADALEGSIEAAGVALEVIPTPGHSADHVAFFERSRGWLFCGDAFVGGQDRELRPESDALGVIASLRRLLALGAAALFPGSGSVYHQPGAVLSQKIAYLEDLGGRIVELHQRGLSARRIRTVVFGRERPVAWITGGDFTSLNLVRSFLRGGSPSPADTRLAVP